MVKAAVVVVVVVVVCFVALCGSMRGTGRYVQPEAIRCTTGGTWPCAELFGFVAPFLSLYYTALTARMDEGKTILAISVHVGNRCGLLYCHPFRWDIKETLFVRGGVGKGDETDCVSSCFFFCCCCSFILPVSKEDILYFGFHQAGVNGVTTSSALLVVRYITLLPFAVCRLQQNSGSTGA